MQDLPYADGGLPPVSLIRNWLKIVAQHAYSVQIMRQGKGKHTNSLIEPALSSSDNEHSDNSENILPCIAVHCVAGLGRAPVLVTIALIEYGMEALDAVELIRRSRKGALNSRQIGWLAEYKRMGIPKAENGSISTGFGAKVGRWFGRRKDN